MPSININNRIVDRNVERDAVASLEKPEPNKGHRKPISVHHPNWARLDGLNLNWKIQTDSRNKAIRLQE